MEMTVGRQEHGGSRWRHTQSGCLFKFPGDTLTGQSNIQSRFREEIKAGAVSVRARNIWLLLRSGCSMRSSQALTGRAVSWEEKLGACSFLEMEEMRSKGNWEGEINAVGKGPKGGNRVTVSKKDLWLCPVLQMVSPRGWPIKSQITEALGSFQRYR